MKGSLINIYLDPEEFQSCAETPHKLGTLCENMILETDMKAHCKARAKAMESSDFHRFEVKTRVCVDRQVLSLNEVGSGVLAAQSPNYSMFCQTIAG